jgi:uncharacterized protein YndB with AHSA1/START domain
MSEILTQFDVDAAPETVWEALTTEDGIRGWWTTQAEVPEGVGTVLALRFPDAPISWICASTRRSRTNGSAGTASVVRRPGWTPTSSSA